MSDDTAPAIAAEGTATPAPEVPMPEAAEAAPEAVPPAANEAEKAHNRRLLAAAAVERRTRAERTAAEKARAEASEQAKKYESWQKQAQEVQSKLERFEQLRANAIRDPRAFLAETGLDLDTIVRAHLEEAPTTDVLLKDAERKTRGEFESVKQEIERLKAELAEKDQRAQQQQAQQASQALMSEIDSTISADPDKYEFIIATEQQSEVYELMRLAYKTHDKVLPVAQAAEMIENYLFDQAKKTAKAKKLAALFQSHEPQATPPQPGKPATQAKQVTDAREPRASNTLTSKLASSPAQPEADETLDLETLSNRAAEKLRSAKATKRAAAK